MNLQPAICCIRSSQLQVIGIPNAALTDPSYNEYTSLFVRDGERVQANAFGGSQATWGDDLVISGLKGPLSLSVGQFHYQTDGWRTNSDYHDDLYNAFAQLALSDKTSVQAEVRTRALEQGDISLRTTQPDLDPTFRRTVNQDTARLGIRHKPSLTTDLIASVVYEDRQERRRSATVGTQFIPIPPFGQTITTTTETTNTRNDRGITTELQLITRAEELSTVIGGGYTGTTGDLTRVDTVTSVPPPSTPLAPNLFRIDTAVSQYNAYVYTVAHVHPVIEATIGVSGDSFNDFTIDRHLFNPKLLRIT